jgi:chromosome segregation ATPase
MRLTQVTTRLALVLSLMLVLSGCGFVHVGRLPVSAPTVVGDDKLMKENSDLRLEKKMLQQELALTRAQGDALRFALENRAAEGDTTKRLVERLNETSKELATLRANYAVLQNERTQIGASAAEVAALRTRLGAAEEQLAGSLRTYTELQGEVTRLKSEVDRTRAENFALSEQVKVVTQRNEQAQAALAQLNTDLLAQKDARQRAEQDAETLRTELKTVAPNASALAQQRTGAAAEARSLVAEHAAETAALREQLGALRTQVDVLARERESLKQQLGEGTPRPPAAELANIEAKLSDALRDATLLRDENEGLKSQLSQLKQSAAGAAGSASLQDQLKDVQSQAAALAQENAALKSRLAGPSAAPAAPSGSYPAPVSAPRIVLTSNGPVVTNGAPAPAAPAAKISGVNATLVANVSGGSGAVRINTAPEVTVGGRVHVVTGGDTLAKISIQYYGSPNRWGDILAANRDVLGENNNLAVGRTLRIP